MGELDRSDNWLRHALERLAEGDTDNLEEGLAPPPAQADLLQPVTAVGRRLRALQRELALSSASEASCRDEFLSALSHDIRTPLSSILGMLEFLTRTNLSEQQQVFVDGADRAARQLLGRTRDALDTAQLDSVALTTTREPFNLEALLRGLLDLYCVAAADRKLDLFVRVDPDLPRQLVGDGARLQQILENLVDNAIRNTDAGRVMLQVSRVVPEGPPAFDPRLTLRFAVSDSGRGIHTDLQRQIFQRFTRAEFHPAGHAGGVGLGLVLCKHLAERMGGNLGVRSSPGAGSTFWLTVEVERQPATEEAPATPLLSGPPKSDLSGHRVLVVDDHRGSLAWMVEDLAGSEFNVLTRATGEAASRALGKAMDAWSPIQLVIVSTSLVDPLAFAAEVQSRPHPPLLLALTDGVRPRLTAPMQRAGYLAALARPLWQFDWQRILPSVGAALADSSRDFRTTLVQALMQEPRRSLVGLSASTTSNERPVLDHPVQVLVVDDDALSREITGLLLESLGCTVLEANSGAQAVHTAEHEALDLVLMDCQMPEMDGFQATARLRDLPPSPRGAPHVVALTADVTERNRARCFAAGMVDCLSKPVTRDALHQAVLHWARPGGPSCSSPVQA